MTRCVRDLVLTVLILVAWRSTSGAQRDPTQGGEARPLPGEFSPELVSNLVAANKILANHGVLDAFGHVSARSERNPQHMLLSRSMAPRSVEPLDIMEFDIRTCTPVREDHRTMYIERYIHCEIYKRNPDIASVVHSHAPSLIPFGVSKVPLKAVYHMSGFLAQGAPVFEIRSSGGEATDMTIRNESLGAALATTLAANAVVLMRGHGATIVGSSVQQAVFRAVYAEINARVELDARMLGSVTFLNESEAANAEANSNAIMERAWESWLGEAVSCR